MSSKKIGNFLIKMYTKWCNREVDQCDLDHMEKHLPQTNQFKKFKIGNTIKGENRMGKYEYVISALPAKTAYELETTYLLKNGSPRIFAPHLHPKEMLEYGVFEGKIINDCMDEFPREWFESAIRQKKLSPQYADDSCNFYKVKSRSSLREWNLKKWTIDQDNRGWFQWYCRYTLGRRDHRIDTIQMKRWSAIARWKAYAQKYPKNKAYKQTLLQWSWPQIDESLIQQE